MNIEQRKEIAILHKELIDILTNCETDMGFLRRLIIAQQIITNEILEFSDKEYNKVADTLPSFYFKR